MERRLYVIYDVEGGVYGPPMEGRNDVIAMRHFMDGLRTSPLPPEMKDQMQLYYWGTMDDETGEFVLEKVLIPRMPLKNPEDLTEVM